MDERDLTEDEVVARLRAADPAADVEPDTAELRSTVDAGIAAAPVDEVAARRARRWTSWPARVAGVAAATLVVGGGAGYAIGSAGGSAPVTADAPITLQVPGDGDGGGRGLGGPELAAADEAALDAAVGGPGYWGRVVFTSSGLSGSGTTVEAFAFDAAAGFTAEAVAEVAAALGVEGEPTFVDGAWSIGSSDGRGPGVQIWPDGYAGVSYWDPEKDPWQCDWALIEENERLMEQADPEFDAGMSEPAMDPCVEQDLGPAPKGDAAMAVLRDTLAALGLDTGAYEFATEDYGDDMWTYVTADLVVDGQRSAARWDAALTGAGLQSLSGPMAPLVSIGDYDVISPAAAVERLSDPRFGGGGGPIGWVGGWPEDTAVWDEPVEAELPAAVAPGAAVSWPVDRATIVEARLGLALHFQADGAALLVPSYELVSDDGAIWSVIAVTEDHLDFSTR